jgi:hypothetical protein
MTFVSILNTFYQQLTHWFYCILQPDAFQPLGVIISGYCNLQWYYYTDWFMLTNKHIVLQHNYFLISKISKHLKLVLSYLPRKLVKRI